MPQEYELAVVGAGVAGLTAGLFGVRYGLRTVLLEESIPGGQIINAEHVENFPGFPESISGADLAARLQDQAMRNGLEIRLAGAKALRLAGQRRVLDTEEGELTSQAVIVAAGSSPRKLGIPGEEELYGHGVSHCATCDGPLFANQAVAVIGGGDTAVDEALTLAQYASQVILLHRRGSLRAQKALRERILAEPKVQVLWHRKAVEVKGDTSVQELITKDMNTGSVGSIPVSGVFIYVGTEPTTAWLRGVLDMDNGGHILTDIWMQTSVPGVFAAGDIRAQSARQLASAAGDGTTAAIAAFRHMAGIM
ncbi:MAG: FAD-dependent oxidoreductase [Chloroflexi bacterium]|nr:FAD-dependent oxidoreductase [Chloroflexota bacterium]